MNSEKWKVVPLSDAQLLDVNPSDILHGGLYRRCDTHKGGNGYDKFPEICERMLGVANMHRHFVVQLYGCNLDCPYCYVTRAGVWGSPQLVSTNDLLYAFQYSRQDVFHLMGGAPAIHLRKWPELIERFELVFPTSVFHSDLLLTERRYSVQELTALEMSRRVLLAVNVKGLTDEEHLRNTRKVFREKLFWANFVRLVVHNVKFYVTFTNVSKENIQAFWVICEELFDYNVAQELRRNSYSIDLIDYKAVMFVDSVEWGIEHDYS